MYMNWIKGIWELLTPQQKLKNHGYLQTRMLRYFKTGLLKKCIRDTYEMKHILVRKFYLNYEYLRNQNRYKHVAIKEQKSNRF